jgi:RNA polymerase sigma-70 factor, ECF subfamily
MTKLSPDAFASRFTACSRTLWCIAAAILNDRTQAEDVLQEAALIALRKLDQFDPDTAFVAWMGQIVRYVALNHARRRTNARTVPVDPGRLDEVVARIEPGPAGTVGGRGEVAADRAGFDDELLAALNELPEDARACLLLRTVLDMPYREIARVLDVPEGTAMSHVHRARAALRARLADRTPASGGRDPDGKDGRGP